MDTAAFIAIDWGTTNFRAYLLDSGGNILDRKDSQHGIKHLKKETFPEYLQQQTANWRDTALPVLMCGMVGSTLGWHEVPYIKCPVLLAELADQCYSADTQLNAWIVPGLHALSPAGQPDVMRGEETQLLGWHTAHPDQHQQLLILPGTHSKWAFFKGGRLENFATAMTGELYAVLKEHSILACADTHQPLDTKAYQEGLEYGKNPAFLHILFSARSRVLTGDLKPEQKASYLAGLLIGNELQHMLTLFTQAGTTPITVIGSSRLIELYTTALNYFGYNHHIMPGDKACILGLLHIYQTQFQHPHELRRKI